MENILIIFGSSILVPILALFSLWIKQHYDSKKQNKHNNEKVDSMIDCLKIIIEHGQFSQEVKDKISKKFKDLEK